MGESHLIFVTVGSGPQGFNRLLEELDKIAGKLNERVIVQAGSSSYPLKNVEFFNFLPKNEINRFYKNARVVVSHAGVGSIITAFSLGKPLVIVPRRKEYGELVDDHQIEIAKELELVGRAKVAWNITDLESAIISASEQVGLSSTKCELINRLNSYISLIEKPIVELKPNGKQFGK